MDSRFDGSGPDLLWRERLAQGVVTIQRCGSCGAHQFPPSLACRKCGSVAVEFVPQKGDAHVYSVTTVRGREGNRNVSIVELPEGPRMMSRVEGVDPEHVRIGDRVRARIALAGEGSPIVVFDWCGASDEK